MFRSIIKKMCKIYEETQILLSQKYGKGDRKFAEIQGTDLTLGAVGSDKILKENPIWNWRQIDLTPFQFAMKKMTVVMMSLCMWMIKNSWKRNWKKTTPPTHSLFHSIPPTIDVPDQLNTAVFPDSCGQPDCWHLQDFKCPTPILAWEGRWIYFVKKSHIDVYHNKAWPLKKYVFFSDGCDYYGNDGDDLYIVGAVCHKSDYFAMLCHDGQLWPCV